MTYETRKDGWPLCPHCGEDELWSGLEWSGDGERPPIEAYIAAGLTCYACNWQSLDFVTQRPVPIPTSGRVAER